MNSDASRLTEEFIRLEKDFELLSLKIDGVAMWERIRFQMHRRLISQRGGVEAPMRTPRRRLVRLVAHAAFGSLARLPQRDILVFGHPRRRLRDDGLWWDVYMDPILDDLPSSWLYLEPPYQGRHFSPAKTRERRLLDALSIRRSLGRMLPPPRLPPKMEAALERADAAFTEATGANLRLVHAARASLRERRTMLPAYLRILRRVRPKLVLLCVSYGQETLIDACRRMEIPTAEIQHGIVDRHHLGYAYPERRKDSFPDRFLAFGSYWTQHVPLPRERVHVVGFPYFEEEAERVRGLPRSQTLLFLSQPTSASRLRAFADQVAEVAPAEWDILYKLHPRDDPDPSVHPRVRVVGEGGPPLYRLLAEAGAVVGVDSTALFEGLALGAKVGVFNATGSDYMRPLVDAGISAPLEDPSDAVALMDAPLVRPPADEFFAPGARERVRSVIQQILHGGR